MTSTVKTSAAPCHQRPSLMWIELFSTVEPVLKDLKSMVSRDGYSLVTGSFTLKCDFLPKTSGPSRQVVSHGCGLSRQVSL